MVRMILAKIRYPFYKGVDFCETNREDGAGRVLSAYAIRLWLCEK